MSAAKPQLRGLLTSQIKKNFIGMTIVSFTAAGAYSILVAEPRKQRYADFYKTYDAEKQLKIMNEAGFMQSYVPGKK
ncbi:PREDICTED: cytochrome c oxidase subunit 6C isoform X2 [Dinoponera quadriceps]|nr:PREDICTED: cytochrome c oxidase subunit 6C isoform X2 [Dinoponera quadriceps]XP_014469467.1 PREDICTED: cytochrome c oxidase subunit 6C isoform X2 [Dinoponera quadriceps]XP_014469468.1 PREDICTED: cytochrome c oxidase subunit 6C isoform X2 [Dinoponera quadriceps]